MVTDTITGNLLNQINTLVKQSLEQKLFPGIEILFARGDQIVLHEAFGKFDQHPGSPDLQKGSIFDLASLTKPLATASAVVHLAERGRLNLEDPVSGIITEFAETEKSNITIHQLLTHSAGFIDWLPLYEPAMDKSQAWKKLVYTPLNYAPGSSVIYSCLGFLVLGELVRRVAGQSLDDYCRSNLFEPLGLISLQFNPPGGTNGIVPTAWCPLRKKHLTGIVHDENAYTFDGEGGNAGLFGTAADIHSYCLMLLSSGSMKGTRIFSEDVAEGFLTNQNPSGIPARTFGWDLNDGSEADMSCGRLMPPGSVGHLGFTGTSIWMDPVSKYIVILLSNRVNISREENIPQMRIFRPKIHTLLLSFNQ